MCKCVRQPVVVGVLQQRDFVTDLGQCAHDVGVRITIGFGIVFGVDPEIEQRELDLPQHGKRGTRVPAVLQSLEQCARQRLAGLGV